MITTEKAGNALGLMGIVSIPLLIGFIIYQSYRQGKEPVPMSGRLWSDEGGCWEKVNEVE